MVSITTQADDVDNARGIVTPAEVCGIFLRLDDVQVTLDLTGEHASVLRQVLEPFLRAGTPVSAEGHTEPPVVVSAVPVQPSSFTGPLALDADDDRAVKNAQALIQKGRALVAATEAARAADRSMALPRTPARKAAKKHRAPTMPVGWQVPPSGQPGPWAMRNSARNWVLRPDITRFRISMGLPTAGKPGKEACDLYDLAREQGEFIPDPKKYPTKLNPHIK